ncbi:MAG TPA: hypothetical protein VJT54_14155 [Verrucomicrobiae bacterium]|nr:hypothetical protein [Verrucomicrobiae bacterium]
MTNSWGIPPVFIAGYTPLGGAVNCCKLNQEDGKFSASDLFGHEDEEDFIDRHERHISLWTLCGHCLSAFDQ